MAALAPFSLVWLKRDLRLRDHEPLCRAIALNQPIMLAYVVEPEQLNDPHMSLRHWRFIYESINDLNEQLATLCPNQLKVVLLEGNLVELLCQLHKLGLQHIFSHQEIGLAYTFERDKKVRSWCNKHQISWHESVYGAVKRPLSNRYSWRSHWRRRIHSDSNDPDLSRAIGVNSDRLAQPFYYAVPDAWKVPCEYYQKGGEQRAWYTLKHFLQARGKEYFGNIGKPMQARKTCSRLSPYLAWGNISIKQVYQYAQKHKKRQGWQRSIAAFSSRLAWHCHFIQKFESEHFMEYRSVNKAYGAFPYLQGELAQQRLEAWQEARTGIPIIDASMRAVKETGYLNFRMRAMLVSFLCHHLNVDWQRGVAFLGRQFLDFEPGIHYPQFQMQAGVTGTNTIRIYNPIKQSIDKDPKGEFIRKWLPELSLVPNEYIHQPETLPPIDGQLIDFVLHRDYCEPIVNVVQAAKEARDRLWSYRKRDDVKKEAYRVLHSHSVLD
jgi:deoxyribodipyrimidine photo-lyase